MNDDDLVYLDAETLGLHPFDHDVWEVAWAVGDGPVHTLQLEHDPVSADPEALKVNGYRHRWRGAHLDADATLKAALRDRWVVGCNPAFDAMRLEVRWWHRGPWKYRLVDVEAYAMPVLGLPRPKGLHSLAQLVRAHGHPVAEPDHTAAQDVRVTRQVFKALRAIQQERLDREVLL